MSPRLVTIHALVLALAVTGAAPEGMAQETRDCHPESHRTV
jgi:hypothetical protein